MVESVMPFPQTEHRSHSSEFDTQFDLVLNRINFVLGIGDFVLECQISVIKMQLYHFDFPHRPNHGFVPLIHSRLYYFVETRHVDWDY
jgi:hypothetical protein